MKIQDSLLNKLGISALVLSLGLAGCRDTPKKFSKTGVYNGFKAHARTNWSGGRSVALYDTTLGTDIFGQNFGVHFSHNGAYTITYTIKVDDHVLPRNHPLRKYANPDSMEKVYTTLKSQAVKEQ